MKRLFAFFLLISHMNTSMFLPQVPETDVYDSEGNQLDDVNSLVEYFAIMVGYDTTADDEDDDSGQFFHLVKMVNHNLTNNTFSLCPDRFGKIIKTTFSDFQSMRIEFVSFEIITPPPEFTTSSLA